MNQIESIDGILFYNWLCPPCTAVDQDPVCTFEKWIDVLRTIPILRCCLQRGRRDGLTESWQVIHVLTHSDIHSKTGVNNHGYIYIYTNTMNIYKEYQRIWPIKSTIAEMTEYYMRRDIGQNTSVCTADDVPAQMSEQVSSYVRMHVVVSKSAQPQKWLIYYMNG